MDAVTELVSRTAAGEPYFDALDAVLLIDFDAMAIDRTLYALAVSMRTRDKRWVRLIGKFPVDIFVEAERTRHLVMILEGLETPFVLEWCGALASLIVHLTMMERVLIRSLPVVATAVEFTKDLRLVFVLGFPATDAVVARAELTRDDDPEYTSAVGILEHVARRSTEDALRLMANARVVRMLSGTARMRMRFYEVIVDADEDAVAAVARGAGKAYTFLANPGTLARHRLEFVRALEHATRFLWRVPDGDTAIAHRVAGFLVGPFVFSYADEIAARVRDEWRVLK